nr:PREDICTED: P2X purinoceptor 6-like isoform X1 [Latimeria chalumnae]|eukprot:XP_014342314.1 PREDICTED: P2X purinoceptor 6-like isoform X1 [Latimeria chalumnae]
MEGQRSCRTPCPNPFDYKTQKFILTHSRMVGTLHRLLQLCILGYLFGWVFLVKKGYQEMDSDPRVSVITKLKGSTITKTQEFGNWLWDVVDYVKPPQGENVFFLVTNAIITPKQRQGHCPEHPSIPDAQCIKDSDCPMGEPVVGGNGIKTGKCVMLDLSQSTCEIYSWCPVENAPLSRHPLLAAAENFTLFIKNTIQFKKFNFLQMNTQTTDDDAYFKTCLYDPVSFPLCPVFRIQDALQEAGYDFQTIAVKGGVVRIIVDWDCDLDRSAICLPHYSFSLQDVHYNFRTVQYYWGKDEREFRKLIKLYGIRFDISVTGKAGRFHIVPATVNLGAGLALLGVVSTACKLLYLHTHTHTHTHIVPATVNLGAGLALLGVVSTACKLLYLHTHTKAYYTYPVCLVKNYCNKESQTDSTFFK